MRYDMCESARDYLAGHGIQASVKRLDSFTGKEGVCIRRVPSATVDRYYDGRRTIAAIYQVVVRSRSERTAMETADRIAELMDGAYIPSNGGKYQFINQEVYTEPEELDTEEPGFFAYQLMLRAEIATI